MALYKSLVPALPTVVYKRGPQYGGTVATTESIVAGLVVAATAFQDVKDLNTPLVASNPEHTIEILKAADVTSETILKYTTLSGDAQDVSGTGALEALKILGIATSSMPIDYGDRWTGTTDVTEYNFSAIYGGQDIRKASYVREGMVWTRFEGGTLPAIGIGVVPSAATDGYVALGTDRIAEITIGITIGTYDDGTDQYALIILTPDMW